MRHCWISEHRRSRFSSQKSLLCHLKRPACELTLEKSPQLECVACFSNLGVLSVPGRPPGDSEYCYLRLWSVKDDARSAGDRIDRLLTPQWKQGYTARCQYIFQTTPRSQCGKIKTGESSLMRPEVRTKLQNITLQIKEKSPGVFPDTTLISVSHDRLREQKLLSVVHQRSRRRARQCFFCSFIKWQEVWTEHAEGETPERKSLWYERQETRRNPSFSHLPVSRHSQRSPGSPSQEHA